MEKPQDQAGGLTRQARLVNRFAITANIFAVAANRTNIHNNAGGMNH